MSNKKAGTTFEEEFCKLASEHGFWAHMLTANIDGQPADVIICKNNISVLVDCKDCKSNRFPFSRIEENQELAMGKWIKAGNNYAVFALKLNDDVWIIPFMILMSLRETGIKQLNKKQIEEEGYSFSEFEETITRGR